MPGTDLCIKIGGWVRAEAVYGGNGYAAKKPKIPGTSRLETGPQILRRPDDGERELLAKCF